MRERSEKSIKRNVALNVTRILLNAVFPVITFPYIARVLKVEDIGRFDFGNSLIGYFSLAASLVVNTYAIREGGKIRDDKQKMNDLVSQLYSLNLIAMLASIGILYGWLIASSYLVPYKAVIWIQSVSVIALPFGIDWIFSVYEDYLYITMRSVLTQAASFVFLFLFVRTEEDFYKYVIISALSVSMPHFINYFVARKYVSVQFRIHNHWKRHWRPVMIFFVHNIATTIYLNSDVTLLGVLSNDRAVGLYSMATKIYMVVKKLVNAATAVVIPRLAYYLGKDEEKYFGLLNKIVNWAVLLSIPLAVGVAELKAELVWLIGGECYQGAVNTVAILAFAVVASILSNVIVNGVLVTQRREGLMISATLVSAAANIALNFYFIPRFAQNGAAITTVMAEFMVLLLSMHFVKDLREKLTFRKTFWQASVSAAFMYGVAVTAKSFFMTLPLLIYVPVLIFLNLILYLFGMLILKNQYVSELAAAVWGRVKTLIRRRL